MSTRFSLQWDVPAVAFAGALAIALGTVQPGHSDDGSASESADHQAEGYSFDLAAWLDERFAQIWADTGATPEVCDDATFLRRVSLDLIGRIPSVAATRQFLNNDSPDKRARIVDKLIADPEDSSQTSELHSEHMARVWRRVMLPAGSQGAAAGPAFEPWLRQQFRENVPYDQIVRQLLTARGEESRQEMIYYQAIGGTPQAEATEMSRVFLGIRIGCAQCHDHPFTDWKQEDFWGMAAFFNGTTMSAGPGGLVPAGQEAPPPGLSDDNATGKIEYEGQTYAAKVLWSEEPVSLEEEQKPRDALAKWMTSHENPTFAANVVNRVWQHFLGRGLVPAVDDLDLTTPEERELVLDDLAKLFVESGFDLRWLIAGICKSQVYQSLSTTDEGVNLTLRQARRPLKTLTPEQMFDSLEQALLLPVSRSSEEAARHNGQMAQIVQRLDESIGRSPEEYTAGVPQTLMLMNGKLMADATTLQKSRTLRAVVDAPFLDDRQKLNTLFLAAFTRLPRDDERELMLKYVHSNATEEVRRSAFGDIFWALLNSPEFVLCR